jgi:hypothetical protein
MTNEDTPARELILSIYERHRHQDRVSPAWLATEAMCALDPARTSHPLEYMMAHLQFRQLARSVCAGRWERGEPGQSEQHDLFPVLQSRYPISRVDNQEPEYIRLELMSDADVEFNILRLRSEAMAKLKHADALEAWNRTRRAA